jgi:hypothetical protein
MVFNNNNYERRPEMETPEYKAWRLSVFKRDSFKCCICESGKHIEAHHIKKFAEYPGLRYLVRNGVTLSKIHHDLVTGREEQWEEQFNDIVASKMQTNKAAKANGGFKKVYRKRNWNIRYGF